MKKLQTPQTVPFDLANPVHFLALGFGSGLLRPAPGTWGTAMGCVLLLLVEPLVSTQTWTFGLLCLAMTLIGVFLCGRTTTDIGLADHGAIVWDEIVGMFVTMLFVPFSLTALCFGFLFFRVFDILKPWPIGWLDERIHGGIGIMLDDLVAALYAGLVLLVLLYFGVL